MTANDFFRMNSVITSLGRWLLSALIAVPCLSLACLVGLFSREKTWALFKALARLQCVLFGIRLEVEDRNHGNYGTRPLVFIQLNQTTLLEILYWPLSLPFPCRFIENVGFALIPFVGWASVAFGGIPIVRQWPWQTRRGFEKAERCLKNGEPLCISMEGRRSPDGRLSPYKKGPVVLALSTQAQIVPVVFQGARETLPYGSWRPTPGRVRVVFCEAISTTGLTLEDRNELVSRLHEIAKAELLKQYL